LPSDHACHRVDTVRAARCLIDSREAVLTMLPAGRPAEHGELVERNWIFAVRVQRLSDHTHVAVVDRSGEMPVYNYSTD